MSIQPPDIGKYLGSRAAELPVSDPLIIAFEAGYLASLLHPADVDPLRVVGDAGDLIMMEKPTDFMRGMAGAFAFTLITSKERTR